MKNKTTRAISNKAVKETETRDIVLPKERTFDRWDESTYS